MKDNKDIDDNSLAAKKRTKTRTISPESSLIDGDRLLEHTKNIITSEYLDEMNSNRSKKKEAGKTSDGKNQCKKEGEENVDDEVGIKISGKNADNGIKQNEGVDENIPSAEIFDEMSIQETDCMNNLELSKASNSDDKITEDCVYGGQFNVLQVHEDENNATFEKSSLLEMMEEKSDEVQKNDKKFKEESPDGRYGRLSKILGHGSQKLVYKAIDTYDAQEVAWSRIEKKDCPNSFLTEINLLKEIQHPNIIKLKDFWVTDKHLILITELMTSGTLREYIKTVSPSLRVIKGWAKQILLAIEYLHKMSMIHRDIKCENIFVNGSTGEVKIGDLGIARKGKQKRYTIVGTPEFMAREVFEGDGYGDGVDIYAFGMALLEMSIREYPYTECTSPHEIFKRVMTGIPPMGLFSVTDACLRVLIMKCIADEEIRINVSECLKHHFITHEGDFIEEADGSSSFKTGCQECFNYLSTYKFQNMTLPSKSILTALSFKEPIINLQFFYMEKERFIKFEFNILKDTENSITEEMISEKVFKYSQTEWIIKVMQDGMHEIKEKIKQTRPADDIFYKWANKEDLSVYMMLNEEKNAQVCSQKIFNINETIGGVMEAPTTPTLTELDFPKINYPDETPICDFVRETSLITKRDVETANTWIKTLKGQDIDKVSDLKILADEDWDSLGLTVFSSRAMKNMLYGKDKHPTKEKDLGPNSCQSFDDAMIIEDFMVSVSTLIEREIPSEWIDKLLKEDVRNVGELRSLTVCDWERFELSVFAKRIIKNIIFKKGKIIKGVKIV